jgi:hypothetical protein
LIRAAASTQPLGAFSWLNIFKDIGGSVDMPTLSKRYDGCYIIRTTLHNKEEDYCTWQVDDARNTIRLLNEHGVDTNNLPAKFPLKLVVQLKHLGWISIQNNGGRRYKYSKQVGSRKSRSTTSQLAKQLGVSIASEEHSVQHMNIKQRITLSLGITIITLMGVFPPWKYVYDFPGAMVVPGLRVERPAGYHFIASPPQIPDDKTVAAVFGFDERRVMEDNDPLSPQSLMEETGRAQPRPKIYARYYFQTQIETRRLLMQCFIAAFFVVGLFFVFPNRRKE